MEALNPTGLEINLSRLIKSEDFAPSPSQSNAILAMIEGVPCVLFCLDGDTWENEAGETSAFDSWLYLKG